MSGTPACAQPITEDDSPPSRKSKGVRLSVDSQSGINKSCQAHLISSIESPDMLSSSPCHGERRKLSQLLLSDGTIKGGEAVTGGHDGMALLCGKHRAVYYAHRDAHKSQRQDFWETGIILKIESGSIQECRLHIQERLNGVEALPSTDARRASRSYRRESIQSETSTVSDKTAFGSPSGVGGGDQSHRNLDSSSSSGLDIPPLVYATADSVSDTSEVVPHTPRFAEAVRKELEELRKTTTRSDIVSKIDQANRSPRLSVGAEG